MTNISKQNAVNNIYSDLYKQVRCASTADVNISTGLVAGQQIDGTTLVAGDLVLLKNQATASQNGIYPATSAGAASRWVNYNSDSAIRSSKVLVQEGTANAGFIWACGNTSAITVGSTSIVYTRVMRETIISATYVIGTDFSTIADALAYIAPYEISSGVTIRLPVGVTTPAASINFTHPNADKINITGAATYTKSLNNSGMNGIQSSSGSSGAWSIVLNLNNVTNIDTNDYCAIKIATGGTNPSYLPGCWKITNVDVPNSRITVLNTQVRASAPSGAVAADIIVFKSMIQWASGKGFTGFPQGFGGFTGLVMLGDNAGTTPLLDMIGRCPLESVGFSGAVIGLRLTNGSIPYGGGYYISTCSAQGFTLQFTSISDSGGQMIITGNSGTGMLAIIGSSPYIRASTSLIAGNTTNTSPAINTLSGNTYILSE